MAEKITAKLWRRLNFELDFCLSLQLVLISRSVLRERTLWVLHCGTLGLLSSMNFSLTSLKEGERLIFTEAEWLFQACGSIFLFSPPACSWAASLNCKDCRLNIWTLQGSYKNRDFAVIFYLKFVFIFLFDPHTASCILLHLVVAHTVQL